MPRSPAALLLFVFFACARGETAAAARPGALQQQIEQAAAEYGVPAPLLLGTAWVQTRFSMNAGAPSLDGAYGLFHLGERDIARAAPLIGEPQEKLRSDALANARGAAALLRETADRVFPQYPDLDERRLGDWFEVLMLASGLDDGRAADDYATQIYRVLRAGLVAGADDGSVVRLSPQSFDLTGRAIWGRLDQALGGASDYCPNGCVTWAPAASSNFTVGRGGNPINLIVIHDMEGSYSSAIAWFENPASKVSAHYDIRSSDGDITQQVLNADTAWHAGNWDVNQHAVGIEHEGFAAQGNTWYTEAMYRASAALVRWLCDKYGIPKDRTHIIGHYEVPNPNNATLFGGADAHHDPCLTWAGSPTWHNVTGCYWDWTHYMSLVSGAPPPPTTGTLTGIIADACCGLTAGARVPIAGATVTVSGQSTTTDAQGSYTFALAPGTYTPHASATGYLTGDHSSVGNGTSANVAVTAGATTWGSILLSKNAPPKAPVVHIDAPADGATVTSASLAVHGTVDDHNATLKVDGNAVTNSAGSFNATVALTSGRNTVTVAATNAGGTTTATATVTYNPPPPPHSGVSGTITSSASGQPLASASVSPHGSAASTADGAGKYQLDLPAGSYTLDITAAGYNAASKSVTVAAGQVTTLDVALDPVAAPPPGASIAIATPPDGIEVGDNAVMVTGKVILPGLATLTVNGAIATYDADGNFSSQVTLSPGANAIAVHAADAAGHVLDTIVHVTYTPAAPPPKTTSSGGGCSTGPAGASGALLMLLTAISRLRFRRRRCRR